MMRTHLLLIPLLVCAGCDDGKIVLTDPEPDPSQGTAEDNQANTDEEERPSELEPNDTDVADTGQDEPRLIDTGSADTALPSLDDADADGFTIEEGDCDDTDPTVHPMATERCDDIDHDCDGVAYNDLLVRYSIALTTPPNHTLFPSSHPSKEPHRHEELWYNYRDYTTDQAALGVTAPEYTGSIRPVVIRVLEVGGVEYETRSMFLHNDDGTLARETRDTDDDGTDDYIATFTHSESGQLLAKEFDADGNGEAERMETLAYDEEGRLTLTMVLSHPFMTPDEMAEYTYDESDGSITIEYSDSEHPSPDSIRWTRYRDDGQPSEASLDENADGESDQTWLYTYDPSDRLTEILQAGAHRVRTTFTYNDAGQLTLKTIDDNDDSLIDQYERHEYNDDGTVLRSEYGTQELEEGVVSERPSHRYEYTRDEKGTWTERRIESFDEDLVVSGVETATHNVDGDWTSWTWTPTASEGPTGTMTTECLGPAAPAIVESF